MTHHKFQRFCAVALAAAMCVGAAGAAQASGQWTSLSNLKQLNKLGSNDSANTITLGWTAWSDAKFMIQLIKQQIETNTSLDVHAQKLQISVQYKAVARGDIDGMVMAWLPDTHAGYWEKYHDQVVDLGPMYNGAIVGWAVPAYVSKAKIGSITDLKDSRIAKQLDGKIIGIDPSAGEMKQSAKAMRDYGLKGQYKLVDGSDQSMTDALARAIQEMKPIVVTLWTPHWAVAKWDMRFLKDPKNEFGGPQHVDVVVRKGFGAEHPKAAKFLSNLHIPLDKLQHAMYVAHQTSEEVAVRRFVEENPALVASWWTGTGAKVSGAAADASVAGSD